MPITLSDEQAAALRSEYAGLQRRAQVGDRATKIWNDPKTSDRAKALWKESFPDDTIEGYDLEQKVNARFDQERKDRETERERQRDAELQRQITDGRERAKQRGFTPDAVERMEKMMVERGIRDYDDAMDLMAAREPRPAEETSGGHFWNHEKQDGFKEVIKDPEQWGFEEIRKAVSNDARARGIR